MSYPKFPVDGKSHSKAIKLADPVAVLTARAKARAHLVAAGDLALIESVDALQIAAERTDLLWLVGQDCVQSILSVAFETFCPVPPTTSEVCVATAQTSPEPASDEANPDDDLAGLSTSFVRACRLADAARGPVPTPPPCPLVRENGVPSASALQREYERTIAAARARYGPAESTLQAAEYLLRLGNAERWRAWLGEHSPAEREAIAQHLKANERKKWLKSPRT
jgi:hypothetical protein